MKLYLREIREEKGLTIRGLSDASGVAINQIERMEQNSINPTIETLCKLAKALGVPASVLFSCDE